MYQNNLEHLLDELHRIDLMVRSNLKNREIGQDADDFQGLYISEKEVNTILQNPPYEIKKNDPLYQDIEKIRAAAFEINKRKIESINNGKELRLHILTEIFHLKPFEVDAILICLASELDLRYEKLYSYMQNDVTRKRPTVDLVIKLLCSSIEEKFRAREYFSTTAPLIKNRLVYLIGDGQEISLLSKSIKMDERIISFLMGTDCIDRRIEIFSSIIEPKKSLNDVIFEDDPKNRLVELIKQLSSSKAPLIIFLHGGYGTGKKMFAEVICRELGKPMLLVNSKALMKDESFETSGIILREALLQNSYIYIEGIDALWKEKDRIDVTNLIQGLDVSPNWIFLSGELPWEPPAVMDNHMFISIQFPPPSFALRKRLWEFFLDGNSEGVDICALATKFKFSGGQIRDAIFTASNAASARGSSRISMEDIYYGCKSQSNRNLSSFAKKIEPRYIWEDIVLPKDKKEQLKEIAGHIKNREIVFADWGFDKKLSLGKGLNILFSGPSGTGKTMAAEIIAKEAGLDLYKIDLSNVVSKYIGETEKNLSNIFKDAETSNAILFFDEADALFGKRSEVKDAHDRYANIEIGYLLQKMEEYVGVVILATNLSGNIDEAFLRRMQFVIELPFPDDKLRMLMWKGIFPKNTPLAKDIDYEFFSEKLKLAGGNIKNIAVTAAFFAAENSREIGMNHILLAAKREYQKLGKPFLKADFEPYYRLIERDER
ncbi:MAG: AAA family ATPase [Candidatus Methanoperedens sp.]|nr:AAA family ATPase [Candidatus Methanoperedens sp.]MCZ7369687.1 AAA family ATPase [Candidatus Methanoperedens sp.]